MRMSECFLAPKDCAKRVGLANGKKALYTLALALLLFQTLCGCELSRSLLDPDGRNDSGANNGQNGNAIAPTWIKSAYGYAADGRGAITVTWENLDDSYVLYRRYGSGSWVLVATVSATSEYTDKAYTSVFSAENQQTFQYAVKGLKGTSESAMSVASNATAPIVLNTAAAVLTDTDKIELSWDSHPEAQSYRVYRMAKAPDAGGVPSQVASIAATSGNSISWYDVPASAGEEPLSSTIYYYLVTWVRDGTEYGMDDGFYRPGAYSRVGVDRYEPNDDWTSLSADDSLFYAAQPPIIYEIGDGYGNVVRDADWYRHETPAGQACKVLVTLPADTPFQDGELTLRFYSEGTLFAEQPIYRGSEGTNEFWFSPTVSSGSQAVFFSVRTKLATQRNVIGTYSVKIDTSL